MTQMAEIIAITGDIGAGKSTVARIMESYGGTRFDADTVARNLWLRSDIRCAAVERWGAEILRDPSQADSEDDGIAVNFSAISKKMFSSRVEYDWGCHLMHPLVMKELARSVAVLSPDQWAVTEIPLLFEVGRPNWANIVIYVTAPRELRLKRCRQRGWTEAELDRRAMFYLPAEDRKSYSDLIIPNDGDLDSLQTQVRNVLETVLHYSSEWLCWLFDTVERAACDQSMFGSMSVRR